jgi:hypothetical protein
METEVSITTKIKASLFLLLSAPVVLVIGLWAIWKQKDAPIIMAPREEKRQDIVLQ